MGIAASLFFSSKIDKQTLHRRITPTEEQFDLQQARWNELADHLRANLKIASGCSIRTWLQGSYKFGTQVRPPKKGDEFDIDLGLYFEWEGNAEGWDKKPADLRCIGSPTLSNTPIMLPGTFERF